MKQNITPLSRIETCVYLPNVAGGFDVRGCPDAENLAAFIVKACNSHDQLVAALRDAASALEYCYDVQHYPGDGTSAQDKSLRMARAALAAVDSE